MARPSLVLPLPSGACAVVVGQRHLRAVAQAVDAVDHHLVAGGEPFGDRRHAAVGRAGDDVPPGNRRVVIQYVYEVAGWPELNGCVRRERDAVQRVDEQPDVDELLREQDAIGVVEESLAS